MPRKKKRVNWKRKFDAVFSEYIRRRHADEFNAATCVTCGTVRHWKDLQCGHYVSRAHMGTRFDEENCNVQCCACNVFKKGNLDEYALYLIETYGDGVLGRLHKKKLAGRKIRAAEYQELIEEYKAKIKNLKSN